jgi:hypothetical protein
MSPYCMYRFIALCGWVLIDVLVCIREFLSAHSYHEHPFLPSDLFLFLQQESRQQVKQLYPSDKLYCTAQKETGLCRGRDKFNWMHLLWETGTVDRTLGTAGWIEIDRQHVQHVHIAVPCAECLNSKRYTLTTLRASTDRQTAANVYTEKCNWSETMDVLCILKVHSNEPGFDHI